MFSASNKEETRQTLERHFGSTLALLESGADVIGCWSAAINGCKSNAGTFTFSADGELSRQQPGAASPSNKYWRIVETGILAFLPDHAAWVAAGYPARWQFVSTEDALLAYCACDGRLILSSGDSSVVFVLTRQAAGAKDG